MVGCGKPFEKDKYVTVEARKCVSWVLLDFLGTSLECRTYDCRYIIAVDTTSIHRNQTSIPLRCTEEPEVTSTTTSLKSGDKHMWEGGLNSGRGIALSTHNRRCMTFIQDVTTLGSIHDCIVEINVNRGDVKSFCDATNQSLENIQVMASKSIALYLTFNMEDDL
jgi:hypothetical protein